MALLSILCPECNSVLKTVQESMNSSQDCVCRSCKERIRFSYNHKNREIVYNFRGGSVTQTV